jgi:hypothetical protein
MAVDTLISRGTLDVGQALFESLEVLEALSTDPSKRKGKGKDAASSTSGAWRGGGRRCCKQPSSQQNAWRARAVGRQQPGCSLPPR